VGLQGLVVYSCDHEWDIWIQAPCVGEVDQDPTGSAQLRCCGQGEFGRCGEEDEIRVGEGWELEIPDPDGLKESMWETPPLKDFHQGGSH
jgi:hypothetical protein